MRWTYIAVFVGCLAFSCDKQGGAKSPGGGQGKPGAGAQGGSDKADGGSGEEDGIVPPPNKPGYAPLD